MERALVTITPSEAKRLIGKAVALLEPVRSALKKGTIVICLGTTNAFVAEEIMGKEIRERGNFAIGIITPLGTCITNPKNRLKELVIRDGKVTELSMKDVLDDLGPEDVFIKGANAIDPFGNAGVFLGSQTGGTLGMSIGVLLSRGVRVIIPVSLEKLIPCPIGEIIPKVGNRRFRYSMKMPVGMMLLPGEIVTEVEAFNILFGCECFPIGGGGVNGGEGARCYLLEGEKLDEVWKGIMKIKGEERVIAQEANCKDCNMQCWRFARIDA
ncbi:MAG: hypothetical protein N3D12_04995 [Candidatus Methanomethyliaceae archaeon]|nr:hypothetical protein [Candidatus Methanomethyliaceae archaeon]